VRRQSSSAEKRSALVGKGGSVVGGEGAAERKVGVKSVACACCRRKERGLGRNMVTRVARVVYQGCVCIRLVRREGGLYIDGERMKLGWGRRRSGGGKLTSGLLSFAAVDCNVNDASRWGTNNAYRYPQLASPLYPYPEEVNHLQIP